jgi:dTMP kinase
VSGRFITLEGIEGVGKTTNLEFIAAELRAAGVEVVVTREPGGVPQAEEIRALLLRPGRAMPPAAELLLMFAARACHVEQLIRPALRRGAWVLCDRFTDASYAYQGAGRRLGAEAVSYLEQWIHGDLQPDLTLLLDLDWQTSLGRRQQRGGSDRFEQEERPFFERVRAEYLRRAALEPARICVIDSSGELGNVQAQIRQRLAPLLRDHLNK